MGGSAAAVTVGPCGRAVEGRVLLSAMDPVAAQVKYSMARGRVGGGRAATPVGPRSRAVLGRVRLSAMNSVAI